MRVLVNDSRAVQFMRARVQMPSTPHHVIGFERDGVIRAAAAYHNFLGNDIAVTVAADNGGPLFGAGSLRVFFQYPFGQLGVRRMTAWVESDNAACLRVIERLGFRREGVKRAAVSDEIDLIMFGMLREECVFWRTDNVP